MSDWQTILAVGIVIAGLTGRLWLVVAIIAANFLATMELAANPINVAIADACAAVVLMFAGKRGQVIAAIYAVMIPLYPTLSAIGFSAYAIYSIVDGLAIAQLIIAGRWDVGSGRAVRLAYSRCSDFLRSDEVGPKLAHRVRISETEGPRR